MLGVCPSVRPHFSVLVHSEPVRGAQAASPVDTSIATQLKHTLDGSLSRLQAKVQSRAHALKARGQSYRVDRLDAIQNDLIGMKAKLAGVDPSSVAGQAELRTFTRTLARLEGRIDTRLGKLTPN